MCQKTISMCQGKGSLSHNNRAFAAKNIDSSRTADNITFVHQNLREAYDILFSDAVERYNARQKRNDRRIPDYFHHLFSREPSACVITGTNKQKSFYEDLVQIGTKDDTGVGTPDSEIAVACLREYMEGFSERNPNFYVFNAVMHLDEATPHLHIDYIPVGHFSNGLDTRNAMAKALEEMGYGKGANAINRWRLTEWEILHQICKAHGVEIAEPKKSRGYSYTTEEYGEHQDRIRQLEEEKAQIITEKEEINAALEKAAKKQPQKEEEAPVLTPEEQKIVNDFAAKIDIENTNQILQYGAGTQKKMADFSDTALENVKTQDLGEIGELISNVVGELKDFDVQEEGKFFGFFRKQTSKIENLKNKYDKAQVNVEKITDSLQQHQVRLMKDSAMLDKMYEQNLNYFKELTMYILAGKKKLEETRNGKLAEMKNKAALSGLPEDAQAARDLDEKCSRFEKKLHDLELTRTIAMQTAPQIRLIQNNDTVMVEKIQTTIVNTIPLWKSQMVLALGIAHSAEAAQAQRQVTDITNELLRKNAETLHMATVETAKESERGIVDLETLQKTNADLIQTLDDVMRIQMEGRQKRQAAEMEMHRMEEELKRKLLEIR